MQRPAPLFKTGFFLLLFVGLGVGVSPAQSETRPSDYSRREASLYRDVFDQTFYYQGTQFLHLERLYRSLFRKEKRALDVNVFDEVPDSPFFTNRHGREALSIEELKRGPGLATGPERGEKLTIEKGKFEGITPGFFVRNEKGEKYLLKFDPMDYLELATGAEAVTSRFFHAIGYNVPQYNLALIQKEELVIDPDARIYDDTGFRKKLTPDRLEEFMLFVPQTSDGAYRASASRLLEGKPLGPMSLQGRRRNDPDDLIDHKDRREIRALQVFATWLNCYDMRESNTLEMLQEEGGKSSIRHYLIDFNTSLGSRPGGPQPPMFGYEYLFDYSEVSKAALSLGLWKKPWQKKWDEADHEIPHPSVGYFDNRYFNPGRYRTQLPYFPFKDLTRADGFWAAKIIMKFTDEEIREIVSMGSYSDPKAQEYLAATLTERRDLLGRFWFRQVNPLDEFELEQTGEGHELRFKDLLVQYKFEPEGTRVYHFDVIGKKGKKGIRLAKEETTETRFPIRREWLDQYGSVDLLIRSGRQGSTRSSPFVSVTIESDGNGVRLTGIRHPD